MSPVSDSKKSLFTSSSFVCFPIVIWLILVGLSHSWNSALIAQSANTISSVRGEFVSRLANLVMTWNLQHELVYVPKTDKTPSNPYLKNSSRDVTTTDGVELTQVPPPQMLRQLSDLFFDDSVSMAIVSQTPLNPVNRANAWQQVVLESYENSPVIYNESVAGEFRYMAPLMTQERCLSCHSQQGYEIGKPAGAFSIVFPSAYIATASEKLHQQNSLIHLFAFLLLSAISSFTLIKIRRLVIRLEQEKQRRDAMIERKTQHLKNEIKQHKIARSELQRLATHDPLTGIRNRRHFIEALSNEVKRYQRYQNNFSLLMLDLDHFKKINDKYGHDCGDYVLREFATQVQLSLRESDVFVRYGGEEFAIIATNTRLDSAKRFADKLIKDIANMVIKFNNQRVTISVSIGVANPSLFDKPSAQLLISSADHALCQAKDKGRSKAICANKEQSMSLI